MKKIIVAFIVIFFSQYTKAQLTFPFLQVQYDSAWICEHYQLIPIVFTPEKNSYNLLPHKFLTLQQALSQKKLLIKENYYDGNENVNSLTIKNTTKEAILILDGELLQGGKQDRMIAETKIIYPNQEENLELLNVFCIEKGRWSKKAKKFTSAGYASSAIRKIADSAKSQQPVWKEIEKQFQQYQLSGDTYPYLQLQKKLVTKDSSCYNYFVQKFKKSNANYAGFIAVYDTIIIATDVFANEFLTKAAFDKIVSAYLQNTYPNNNVSTQIPKTKLELFANAVLGSEASQKKFIEHHGILFYNNKKPLHLTAYGN